MSDESASPEAADALLQRARLAEGRLAEVLAAYRTLKTENDGYRDRITRNLERRYDQRRERLLLRFIEILDNLDRALESAERSYLGDSVVEGLILVRTQLLQTLQEEGLERIPVVGLPYDPAVSEAVGTEPVGDPDQHHVVLKDLLRGYRLAGRIARASKVLIGDYRADAGAEEAVPTAEAMIGAAAGEAIEPEQGVSPPEAPATSASDPAPAAAPGSPSKKGDKEITFSKLDLDLASAVHEAAAAATEIEDGDGLPEIARDVAPGPTTDTGAGNGQRDDKKDE